MSANLKFGLFLIALLCAMGVAGQGDYEEKKRHEVSNAGVF
jgi:uncharacterized lipoprotein YehR (DUF1307 family)